MIRRTLFAIFFVALALTLARESAAESSYPHWRRGFYAGAGFGWASASAVSLGERSAWVGGGNFVGRFGWAIVRNRLTIGFDGTSFSQLISGRKVRGGVGLAALTFFPTDVGFYLKGGLGGGRVTAEDRQPGGLRTWEIENGFAVHGGVGWEFRVTPIMALGPEVAYTHIDINQGIESAAWLHIAVPFTLYF